VTSFFASCITIVRAPNAELFVSVMGNCTPGVPSCAVTAVSVPTVMSPGPVMDTFMLLERPGPNIVTVALPCPRETVSPVTVAPPCARFTPRNFAFGVGVDCGETTLMLMPLALAPAETVTSDGLPGAPPPPPPPPLLLVLLLPPPQAANTLIVQKIEARENLVIDTKHSHYFQIGCPALKCGLLIILDMTASHQYECMKIMSIVVPDHRLVKAKRYSEF
jgi:hypothetical protein